MALGVGLWGRNAVRINAGSVLRITSWGLSLKYVLVTFWTKAGTPKTGENDNERRRRRRLCCHHGIILRCWVDRKASTSLAFCQTRVHAQQYTKAYCIFTVAKFLAPVAAWVDCEPEAVPANKVPRNWPKKCPLPEGMGLSSRSFLVSESWGRNHEWRGTGVEARDFGPSSPRARNLAVCTKWNARHFW